MTWCGLFDDFKVVSSEEAEIPQSKSNVHQKKTSTNIKIKELHAGVQSANIVGIILAKDGPKSFINKKGSGGERFLMSFTLRDSPDYLINVTCWGKEEYIKNLAATTFIGDVVQLNSVQVQQKAGDEQEAKFKPWTSSPFRLNLSENSGSLTPYGGWDTSRYSTLLQTPLPAKDDYYTLADILTQGTILHGEHLNLQVAVRRVGPMRMFKAKTGKDIKKCEILLFDETCQSFVLDLWDDYAALARSWTPFVTVLYATDVKILFSEYKATMTATVDSKTILITNPATPKTQSLHQYAYALMDLEDTAVFNSVTNMKLSTIDEIIEQKCNLMTQSERSVVYAKCQAFLTCFNIDSDDMSMFSTVCAACRRRLKEEENFQCGNPACSTASNNRLTDADLDYLIFVSLSDHTATLNFCYLSQQAAEEWIGCKAGDFIKLGPQQKTKLKWNHLMEKRIFYLKTRKPLQPARHPRVTILSLAALT